MAVLVGGAVGAHAAVAAARGHQRAGLTGAPGRRRAAAGVARRVDVARRAAGVRGRVARLIDRAVGGAGAAADVIAAGAEAGLAGRVADAARAQRLTERARGRRRAVDAGGATAAAAVARLAG